MLFDNLKIGFAITGSFCTAQKIFTQIENIIKEGAEVFPIISTSVKNFDTKFGAKEDMVEKLEKITGKTVISSIVEAEPIGPKAMLDALVIAPCTGNTLGKITHGITDTAVTMAFKAHVRNQRPVIIAISTNDGLGLNAKNIGELLNMKNIYIVPFRQDEPKGKPRSVISNVELIIPTISEALEGRQIQPILI